MKRLLRAIWHLGPRLGWRYWRIENRCIANPELVLKLALDCRVEALCIRTGDFYEDDRLCRLMLDWAHELEMSYANYTKKTPQ